MSPSISTAIVLGLGLLFIYPHVLYPLIVRLMPARFHPRPERTTNPSVSPNAPKVSVLIPAHNEARHLRGKLNNTLNLDYPAGKLEIVVCSDGSTDGTDAIAQSFEARGVRLIRNEIQGGKASALDHLLRESSHSLVLFSDASAWLDPRSLPRLVDAMADEEVGVAVARYAVRRSDDEAAVSPEAESAYWDFEARLRRDESDRDMLLGASGAGYLVRRFLIPDVPSDTVNDDYVIPLAARIAGARVVYVHDAVASDYPTESSRTLYRRWVRIAYGNFQMFTRNLGALSPFEPRVALPVWRKILRTLGPWFLLGALTVATLGADGSAVLSAAAAFGAIALSVGAAACIMDGTGFGVWQPVRLIRFMTLAQAAYLHGSIRFITGRGRGIWGRAPENEVLDLSRPAPIPDSVRRIKRCIDVLGAVVALVVFAPVMAIVAVWIRLDSKGDIFYSQERERPGADGRPVPFKMHKFRSMVMDAEKHTGPVWAAKTLSGRVTRVGSFIRKYRIDELPQFINVLLGDMSIVGPRPERPFFTRMLEEQIPGYLDRISVIKPGITGWAQVHVATDTSIDSVKEKVEHDLAYLAHLYGVGSFLRMELRVLWRTVFVMISGKGAA